MKTIILLFTALIIFSCDTNNRDTKRSDIDNTGDPYDAEKVKTSKDINDKIYEKVFIATQENNNDTFYQELSVNWISKNIIEYKLFYSNDLCEGECTGKAINKNPEMDQEIDEHEGNTYPAILYEEKKENMLIIIKIDTIYKNRATASFFEGKYRSECSPYEYVMLAKKN